MKKLVLCTILATLALFLCSCGVTSEPLPTASPSGSPAGLPSESPETTAPQSDTPTPPPDPVIDELDETANIMGISISFGMTADEVMDILSGNGFPENELLRYPLYNTSDDWRHEALAVKETTFTFDASIKLCSSSTKNASTTRGFTPKDDVTRMIELYGDDFKTLYNRQDKRQYICEYDFGEYYLDFYGNYVTGIINGWTVSRYSLEERDNFAPQSVAPAPLTSSDSGEVIPAEEPNETVNIAGLFSFGMTLDEVWDTALANGYDQKYFEGYEHYSTLDNGVHEELSTGGVAFLFDASGNLYDCWTSIASTARGFMPGDDTARMIELYGNDYKQTDSELDNDIYFCEYSFDEYHLVFEVYRDTGIIRTWEVSRYSLEERIAASD